MPIIYWCCSRGKVYPLVQRLLLHSPVWQLSDGDCITVEWNIVCQVSDFFTQLMFAFRFRCPDPHVSHLRVSCFPTPELIPAAPGRITHMTLISPHCLYSSQHQLHCKPDSNDSLGSLGNQVLRSGEIHFTLQQRDKEMVRQRESGRERGLKKEREWGE